jgi:hypothetical protein
MPELRERFMQEVIVHLGLEAEALSAVMQGFKVFNGERFVLLSIWVPSP